MGRKEFTNRHQIENGFQIRMQTPYTYETLTEDFIDLGIAKGDTLFIHSSFKSLGPVEGGAGTVIAALEATVGVEGLILMPTFSLLPSREERVAAWNVGKTPSTVGWLTEFFRQMPDTYRSDHYSHAVAARGKDAKRLCPIIFDLKATHRRGIITRGAKLTARIHRCSVPTARRTPNSL